MAIGFFTGTGGDSATDRGAWSAAISAGNSVTIPEGYHNGKGKVSANQTEVTNREAWEGISYRGTTISASVGETGVYWIHVTGFNLKALTIKAGGQTISTNNWGFQSFERSLSKGQTVEAIGYSAYTGLNGTINLIVVRRR